MQKFVCLHGHFYQPPRENPWLEGVELQDSAAPYHDWNERITAECYAPNASARILDGSGQIASIISNYARISFNFGPTLLAWLKDRMPEVHEAIVQADAESRERYSGHGSAIAQAYNHIILPLANRRDKRTQVIWGIRDFEHRFGRAPEGLWLPETAADTDTLEVLAELGIRFTILSPFQASRVREIGKRNWRNVDGGQIDPSRAYGIRLPSGRTISAFFYDAPVSQAVAFERLLSNGERLAHRLLGAFNEHRQRDQLVHIATDGESYGHHHRHGEMALAYALNYIESNKLARLTNYGEFLATHPPTHEAQIHEKTAWSCVHGVGRWLEDCGCNSGGHQGWNQGWRSPLRNALDWLRDELAPRYERLAGTLLKDPWQARDDYISVINDREDANRQAFLAQHQTRPLERHEQVSVWRLLELQRHAMLMYTSCGWFFDEVSGIETVQVIQYAARAIQLQRDLFGGDLEPEFLNRLEHARSNIPDHCNGRCIFEKFVRPAQIDQPRAAAHYAISSVFQQYDKRTRIFSFTFEDEHRDFMTSGKSRLALGRARITSEITLEEWAFTYGILYMGEHNLTGGVISRTAPEAYDEILRDLRESYGAADFPETIRRLDRHFGQAVCSLMSLFKDEQRRILEEILATTREDMEHRFRLIVERYEPLMKFLQRAGAPLPAALETVTDFVAHSAIRRHFDAAPMDLERLRTLLPEAATRGGRVLDDEIAYIIARRMEREIRLLVDNPCDGDELRRLEELARLVVPLPLSLNLAKVQDSYWDLLQRVYPEFRHKAEAGDAAAFRWASDFLALGTHLGFAVPKLPEPVAARLAA